MFYVDGIVKVWTTIFNQKTSFDLPPRGIYPHYFFPTTLNIEQVSDLPAEVEEGEPFEEPLKLRVTDANGVP